MIFELIPSTLRMATPLGFAALGEFTPSVPG